MTYNTAFFTGHRNIEFSSDVIRAIDKLIDVAVAKGVTNFLVGMAFGSDLIAAGILVKRNLHWQAVLPCAPEYQTLYWSEESRNIYYWLLGHANGQIQLAEEYTPSVYMKRNSYLVRHSDICLAVWDGRTSQSGTFHCLGLAQKSEKLVYWYESTQKVFAYYDYSKKNRSKIICHAN